MTVSTAPLSQFILFLFGPNIHFNTLLKEHLCLACKTPILAATRNDRLNQRLVCSQYFNIYVLRSYRWVKTI